MASEAAVHDTEDGKLLVEAITRFALDLYKEQGKRSKGNMFMSPFSISAVLSMAYLGARGQTMEEMKKTLSFHHLDDDKIHQAFADLMSYLKSCNDKVTEIRTCKVVNGERCWETVTVEEPIFKLFMANRLYGEQSYKFLQDFQRNCQQYYGAELCPVDFKKESRKAVEEINSWVFESTNNKIRDILSSDSVDEVTRLILVNAIYFKSDWENQFEQRRTQDDDFFTSSEETVKVQMMFKQFKYATYCYIDDLRCQVLELPYKSRALSMIIFLPGKAASLESLEKNLTAGHLLNINNAFKRSIEVNLWLPKFKFEETLKLKEVLFEMGMKSLFQCADLSGIDGTRELSASQVIQKTFVDVNEEGTEAAAATEIDFLCGSCGGKEKEPPVDFRADRPFLFVIVECERRAILFIGRVIKPEYK